MKFLCVECDVPMALRETIGPENGSMTVVFACRSCGRKIAMLTNEMETQMVHSLGVKIGGRTEAAPPMETIRSSLAGFGGDASQVVATGDDFASRDDIATSEDVAAAHKKDSSGGCPFSEMIAGSMDSTESEQGLEGSSGNGYGAPAEKPTLRWTAEAKHRMERIPSFVRPMVERGIEDYAKANEITLVDEDILQDVRNRFGF